MNMTDYIFEWSNDFGATWEDVSSEEVFDNLIIYHRGTSVPLEILFSGGTVKVQGDKYWIRKKEW